MTYLHDEPGTATMWPLDRDSRIQQHEGEKSIPVGADHAVIVTDLDGIIRDWNPGAEKLFGYARAEVVGQSASLIVPDNWENMRLARRNRSCTVPAACRAKDGALVDVRLIVAPVGDESGVPAAAVLVAQVHAERSCVDGQLRQTQKTEAFRHVAADLAHDFNNLLTVMLGSCEMLMRRFDPKDSTREVLLAIHQAGLRAETLTRQLLSFSRKRVIDMKVFDLNAVVHEAAAMLRRSLRNDIALITNLAPAAALVKLDRAQMEQVILNLAFNARDAMPRGGKLTLETDMVTLAHAAASTPPIDYVMLAVTDTGAGMNAATKARIFEPYFTTKGPDKGTGLGLSSVKNIVEQNGGRIEVDSVPGRGSSFRVYLPAMAVATRTHTTPVAESMPHGRETILIAEDDDGVRALACEVLEKCGYTVHVAKDGEHALELFETYADAIDMLVSDVSMPFLDGPVLAGRLLQQKPQLKVLYVSGYSNEVIHSYGIRDTDRDFLLKPFDTNTLARKVRLLLDEAPQRRNSD